MKISEIMTSNPICCTPDTTLKDAARMMAENDCGQIPVCDSKENGEVVGVITDRDIVCRAVADGLDIHRTRVRECMSAPVITLASDSDLEDAIDLMELNMIRRLPIIDDTNCVCGMLSLSDIACKTDGRKTTEVTKEVSRPTEEPSRVGTASMR